MLDVKYRFYPSLLNSFQMFLNEDGYENSEGDSVVFVTFDDLINQINRVPFPTSEAMQKGNDFENDVLIMAKNGKDSWVHTLDDYSRNCINSKTQYPNLEYIEVLKEVTDSLPWAFTTQKFCRKIYKNIEFYGKIDFAGVGRIIDTKFVSQYQFPKYKNSFQNLYLWALQEQGFRSMEYVISTGKIVYKEYYGLDYDFSDLLEKMEMFVEFIEQNRNLITDKKIFNLK